jgi:hypothetical protein
MPIDQTDGNVTFAPIDAKTVRSDVTDKSKTKEILDKAAVAVDNEREDLEDLNTSFDSKRWLNLMFGFMRDPVIIIATIVFGIFTASWFASMAAMGTVVKMEPIQALIAQIAIFVVLCFPILGSICVVGLAILPMAANRKSRVEEWPFGRIAESFGECMMVLASLIAASIPGGMLASALNAAGSHPAVSLAFLFVSVWGFFPILLLSLIENGSIFEPYSKEVLASLKSKKDAWGGMYMQTALAWFVLYFAILMGLGPGITGALFVGFLFPFVCFFVSNQIGLLAGRISDVTDMGFEGDFSDD